MPVDVKSPRTGILTARAEIEQVPFVVCGVWYEVAAAIARVRLCRLAVAGGSSSVDSFSKVSFEVTAGRCRLFSFVFFFRRGSPELFCFEKYFSTVKSFFRALCRALQADTSRRRAAGGDVPGRLMRKGCCRGIFVLARAATASGRVLQSLLRRMMPRPM